MNVTLYNVKLPADLSVLHNWGTVSARDSWLITNAGVGGLATFSCNMLFPDDGGIIQVPTDTAISDACTYAVFNDGTESRCYFVREVNHTARGAATLRLELDMWGTWYGVGHLDDVRDLHIIAGHSDNGVIRPLTTTIQAPIPFSALTATNIFPSGKYAAVAIFAMANYYKIAVATDNINPTDPPADELNVAMEKAANLAKITKIKDIEATEKPVEYDNISAVGVWVVPAELISTIWSKYVANANRNRYSGYWLNVPIVPIKFANYQVNPVDQTFRGSYTRVCDKKALGVTRVIKIGGTYHEYADVLGDLTVKMSITANDNSLSIWISTDGDNIDVTDEYSVPVYSDQAQSYYAQHKTSIGVGMISSGVSLVGSLAAKNVVGAVGAGLSLANQLGQLSERLKQPCRVNGTPSGFVACDPNGDNGGRWFYLCGYNTASVVDNFYKYGHALDHQADSLSDVSFAAYTAPTYSRVTGIDTGTTQQIENRFLQVDRCICYAPGYGVNAADRLKRALFTGVYLHNDES